MHKIDKQTLVEVELIINGKRKKEDLEKERQASKDSNPKEFGEFIRDIYKETTRKMSINEEV